MIRIKLRQLLWDKELTAVAVHKATGISQSIISEIIHNKRVNVGLDIINKLCIFLECDISDILEFVPENN
jgi:putative transcriptional regulator